MFLLGSILTFHGTKWIREYTRTLQGTKSSLLQIFDFHTQQILYVHQLHIIYIIYKVENTLSGPTTNIQKKRKSDDKELAETERPEIKNDQGFN